MPLLQWTVQIEKQSVSTFDRPLLFRYALLLNRRFLTIDSKSLADVNNGSDQLPDAAPLVCKPDDVIICNRQALHGSFANTSHNQRVTFNVGFHRRKSVLNVEMRFDDYPIIYDEEWIYERSRLITLGIDARRSCYPNEPHFVYQPLVGKEEENHWRESARDTIPKEYNRRDLGNVEDSPLKQTASSQSIKRQRRLIMEGIMQALF